MINPIKYNNPVIAGLNLDEEKNCCKNGFIGLIKYILNVPSSNSWDKLVKYRKLAVTWKTNCDINKKKIISYIFQSKIVGNAF